MSSFGGQWRVLRHYLSANNLNAEVEKLLQKMKSASPDQWDSLYKRLEKMVSQPLTQMRIQPEKAGLECTVQASVVEGTEKLQSNTSVAETPVNEVPTKAPPAPAAAPPAQSPALAVAPARRPAPRPPSRDWRAGPAAQSSVHARTAYVVSALAAAEAEACRAARVEAFVEHLQRYPEARDLAVKEGALRVLLRLEERAPADSALAGALAEALSLAGYAAPPGGEGARVLALDGGGVRGLAALELLRHLEARAGLPVRKLFDYIVGVSTGAIIAAVIGSGAGSLDTASAMYHKLSKEMFGNTSLIGGTSRLVWTHSYYDTAAWERMLRDNLGEVSLTGCNRFDAPKLALVSCVVSAGSRPSPFVFRSYQPGPRRRSAYPGSSRAALWQAVRASAAAPTYFDEFHLDGQLHQDGGIMVNNPAGVGLHEARLVFGRAALRRALLVSLGTGRPPRAPPRPARAPTSWRDKFHKILDSATDTEGVHLMVNELMPPGRYFRFNPPLLEDCAMDEVDPAKLAALLEDTRAYIRRNQHKLDEVAAALVKPRPALARAGDYLSRQATLLGLRRD